jgi:hypothetical protein
MNQSRRKFFKGFGLLGAAMAGAATVKIAVEQIEKPVEEHSHLAPEPNTTLMLTGDNRTPEQKQATMSPPSNGFMFLQQPQVTNQVSLAVGKDNRLWIKVDEQWKRVSVDA